MWGFEMVGPGRLRAVDLAEPGADDLASGEAVVAFRAGGLCGSDYPEFRDRLLSVVSAPGERRPPLHEVVGTVTSTRSEALPVGAQVVGWVEDYHGLSEFVVVSDEHVVEVPRDLDPERAVLAQPLACVLSAVERLGNVAGTRVAVLGLGPIGLLFCHVLQARGASVTGVDRLDRSRLARAAGARELVRNGARAWARSVDPDEAPEIVVEAIGHQPGTLGDAIHAVGEGGVVLAFGINDDPMYAIDMSAMVRKRLTLIAGIASDHRRHLRAAVAELRRHPELAGTLVTDVVPVAQAQSAYDAAVAPHGELGKVVLTAQATAQATA